MAYPANNQDERRRFKHIVTFPDSVATPSLRDYEDNSIAFENQIISWIGRRPTEDKDWIKKCRKSIGRMLGC